MISSSQATTSAAAAPGRRRFDEDPRRTPLAELLRAFQDRRHHQILEHLRRARRLLEMGFGAAQERRRFEDRIRDDWHDSRAVIIKAGKIVGQKTM